jgi:4-hydroxythreonine-4-phosphate dehydrogenase
MKPTFALTIGDPAGIGPEIAVKVITKKEISALSHLIIFGSLSIVRYYLSLLKLPQEINVIRKIDDFKSGMINIYDVATLDLEEIKIGTISAKCGQAAFSYLNTAINWAMNGFVDGIITCPLNKEALQLAGFNYNGHTEILAEKSHTKNYAMVLLSDDLNIIHVTTHLALKKVPELLDSLSISKYIQLANKTMELLGRDKPKIAVSALNPHAGEGGIFGDEEREKILPAILEARKNNLDVYGPFSPDTVFYRAKNGEFDIVVAMYHDQGHIAMKLIHFDDSVNYTVGLPFIRTSVDHGTAFDIAGKLIAKTSSLEKAIVIAARIYNNKIFKSKI